MVAINHPRQIYGPHRSLFHEAPRNNDAGKSLMQKLIFKSAFPPHLPFRTDEIIDWNVESSSVSPITCARISSKLSFRGLNVDEDLVIFQNVTLLVYNSLNFDTFEM